MGSPIHLEALMQYCPMSYVWALVDVDSLLKCTPIYTDKCMTPGWFDFMPHHGLAMYCPDTFNCSINQCGLMVLSIPYSKFKFDWTIAYDMSHRICAWFVFCFVLLWLMDQKPYSLGLLHWCDCPCVNERTGRIWVKIEHNKAWRVCKWLPLCQWKNSRRIWVKIEHNKVWMMCIILGMYYSPIPSCDGLIAVKLCT